MALPEIPTTVPPRASRRPRPPPPHSQTRPFAAPMNPFQEPMSVGVESRLSAIGVLSRWLRTGDFPDRLLSDKSRDRGFVMDLVFGAVRHRRTLEWALSKFLRREPAFELRATLLAGAQQILFMDDVADYAAIHETVEAAKRGQSRQPAFVNAVLRNLLRHRDQLRAELATQSLALRTSHPDLLVDRWTTAFGADVAQRLCELDNEAAETIVIALPFSDEGRAAELLARWTADGVSARPHPAEPGAIILGHGARVEDLWGFHEGLFVVQDPATLAAIRLLAPAPGLSALDACAAPGGKTLQIVSSLGSSDPMTSMDLHEDRLARLRENLGRCGYADRVKVVAGDATSPKTAEKIARDGRPDLLLLDAPCSNTGVLRRRVDARWRFDGKRFAELRKTQLAMLENLAPLARLRVVYSTCSLEPEEDEEVVRAFLAGHPEFRLEASVKVMPDDSPRDGAFAAALVRK